MTYNKYTKELFMALDRFQCTAKRVMLKSNKTFTFMKYFSGKGHGAEWVGGVGGTNK